MALVFSGITPHSLALLPGLSTSKLPALQPAIIQAKKFASAWAEANPEVSIIISPHGAILPTAWVLNIHHEFQIDLTEFGDMSDHEELVGAYRLADDIVSAAHSHFPVTGMSETILDYGCAVPLTQFSTPPKFSVLPFYISQLSLLEHYRLGQWLGLFIQKRLERIALVASADLSHRLSTSSPAGFSPQAKWFEKRILKAIETGDVEEIVAFDNVLLNEVQECGLRPILVLLGAMSNYALKPKLLAHETPVGVGWLYAKYE